MKSDIKGRLSIHRIIYNLCTDSAGVKEVILKTSFSHRMTMLRINKSFFLHMQETPNLRKYTQSVPRNMAGGEKFKMSSSTVC